MTFTSLFVLFYVRIQFAYLVIGAIVWQGLARTSIIQKILWKQEFAKK